MPNVKPLHLFTIIAALSITGFSASIHAEPSEQTECTTEDLSDIKRFNNKAKRLLKEREKLMKKLPKKGSFSAVSKTKSKIKEIDNFFGSDEFYEKQDIYERCGVEMPSKR